MARRKGYRSYYEYRTLFDSGRIAPTGTPIPKGERAKTRGHRGTGSFLRHLKRGYTISLLQPISNIVRDKRGNFPRIDKLVIDNRGEGRIFSLRNLTRDELIATIRAERAKGVVFVAAPSLDQQRLIPADELDAPPITAKKLRAAGLKAYEPGELEAAMRKPKRARRAV